MMYLVSTLKATIESSLGHHKRKAQCA